MRGPKCKKSRNDLGFLRLNPKIQISKKTMTDVGEQSEMEQKAIETARIEFGRAFQSMDDLIASNHFTEVERHWSAFLVSIGRIYTKLEQGSKISGTSKAWWGRKVHERKIDPLLKYLWHARNADEHTIRAVTEQYPGKVTKVEPTEKEIDEFHQKMKDQPHPYVGLGMIEVVFPHVKLVHVIDCGVKFDIPHEHLGSAISAPDPKNVGLLALAYMEKMLLEAEALANL